MSIWLPSLKLQTKTAGAHSVNLKEEYDLFNISHMALFKYFLRKDSEGECNDSRIEYIMKPFEEFVKPSVNTPENIGSTFLPLELAATSSVVWSQHPHGQVLRLSASEGGAMSSCRESEA